MIIRNEISVPEGVKSGTEGREGTHEPQDDLDLVGASLERCFGWACLDNGGGADLSVIFPGSFDLSEFWLGSFFQGFATLGGGSPFGKSFTFPPLFGGAGVVEAVQFPLNKLYKLEPMEGFFALGGESNASSFGN